MSDATTGWTSARVEQLAKLWADGQSASQIAAVLGGGVTRNAVIGKVHRLGLSGRSKTGAAPVQPRASKGNTRAPAHPMALGEGARPNEGEPGPAETRVQQPASVPWKKADVALPESRRVTILELRDSMCRWPIGDPSRPEFGFCGQRAVAGLPYCGAHCQVAYQPATERKRLRA